MMLDVDFVELRRVLNICRSAHWSGIVLLASCCVVGGWVIRAERVEASRADARNG
jgi:hypothetical protein